MMKFLVAVLLALCIVPVSATEPAPMYTIDNPRIVLHANKQLVQIKWYQYVQSSPKLVIAVKMTNSRQSSSIACEPIEYGYKYCYQVLNTRFAESQWITVTDRQWHKHDRYYLTQHDFTSHNAPYGPYEAR